ncbi:3-hydroxyacyl-CoA dehydrogenase [Ornithinibacillus halotolerans]|uniref:3-hydroxybutyryl-CoA dehydrogenase n=1 Tax=Ornithinibacillus halotolerans TaxID=1274357 RepID=A0A916WEQ4_9BACI|nr:3-hydroxyacyl-CoA dehydrogenase [Ornithinibacillus halotolerans]GGA91437.1 3-hydroxybutyryl-CoA dehydrogenase [Ornithinibacillus halotolerans]
MNYKKVMVAGSGVLGSQIAFQTAFFGYNVNVYDISDDAIQSAKERLTKLKAVYADYFNSEEKAEAAYGRLSFSIDLAESVSNVDLVIEAVPEVVQIKQDFYNKLAAVAPEKTVFVSNSSTMLPSQFAEFTGRPEKFLALHFANTIYKNNTAEIMGHAGTDPKYTEEVTEFARTIGMIPFVVKKEQPGYILNSLLVPFLNAGLSLWANDIAEPQTIDKNWMISTGAPHGPFAILDIIGMETPYNLNLAKSELDPNYKLIAEKLKKEMIDQGKMGQATGEGFYTYPNPAFLEADFLKQN